jgi:hypothetical protein
MSSLMKPGGRQDRRPSRASRASRCLAALVLTLALIGVAAPASRAETRTKSLYMVSVGITNARGHAVLKATAKDALDMAKWAQSQKDKLYGRVQVTTLTNEKATRQNIGRHLSGLESKAASGDYVIFYVSCHGGQNKAGEYHFCAYDGDLMWGQIKAALRHVPGTKIVILDTCHAGAASGIEQLIVFAACQANQESHDGSSPSGNSTYTRFLLEGLYGKADFNKDGLVTLAEAAGYASGKLKHLYQNHVPKNQQFSLWYKPKGVSADLPLAKLSSGAGLDTGVSGTSRQSVKTSLTAENRGASTK